MSEWEKIDQSLYEVHCIRTFLCIFSELLHIYVIYRVLYEQANHQNVIDFTFSNPTPRPQPQQRRRYYKTSVEKMSKEISNAHLRKIMISDGSNDIKQLVLCDVV